MTALRVFDDEWTELAPRLASVLAAKGVRPEDRDDLLQETALRLYRVWENLSAEQPVWPFAVTIALNLWRDQVRAAVVRQRDVVAVNLESALGDAAGIADVERTVLARQELAQVGVAMRTLAPESRRLLLENDEVASVLAPLRPSERMARMRARRELARLVGRASAALALLLWRRPLRANACAAAACAGMLAASVFAPLAVPDVQPFAPQAIPQLAVAAPASASVPGVHAPVVRRRAARTQAGLVASALRQPVVPRTPATELCPPAAAGGSSRRNDSVVVVGSGSVSQDDGSGQQEIVETPPMQADSGGCVHIG